MATDEEIRAVIGAATEFVLMYPRVATTPHLTRIHVAGTLAFLATEAERLGVYDPFDVVVRCLANGGQPDPEDRGRL
ncbi:hypothetical protein ACQHIV_42100 (plasmid) [Kribbella sp. GL6]|uniref:hypothetical protein n=1 Tax=Kribbella sp. GL6 TaxID=3419765 RepID=UPI003CFC6FD5